MSDDSDVVRRINNQLATIAENQARFDERQAEFDKRQVEFEERQRKFDQNMAAMQEAIAGLIQVARIHDEQIERNSRQIAELREGSIEQREHLDALLHIVEGHITNHP
jgi:septal ring factor EnvC (AmiA/AmiB activator)